MSRICLVAIGMLVSGCGVDAVDAIPDGLVVSQQAPDVIAGTFGQDGNGIRFAFSMRPGVREAILSDAAGATLEDVAAGSIDGTGFVEANLLDRLWIATTQSDPVVDAGSNASVLDDLAARPEMQLVAPLQASLSVAPDDARTSFWVDLFMIHGTEWSWSTIYLVD